MKVFNRICSFIIICTMICTLQNISVVYADDVNKLVDFTVKVEEGRMPRILHLTDTQIIESEQARTANRLGSSQKERWSATKKEENCYAAVRQVVEEFKPDLIIFTGDFVYGEFDDSGAALLDQIDFFDSLGIPWAPVFGNHENESTKGADWQCEQLEKSKYCLFKQRTLTGNGNYTVGITQGGNLKRVFVMLDSNGCSAASEATLANGHSKKSVGFGSDQIKWYTDEIQKIKKASPDTKFSAAFHIQLNAFQEALDTYAEYYGDKDDATEQINLNLDKCGINGDYGYIGRDTKSVWDKDNTVFNGFKALGVDSIFNGHEHCNNGSILYQGVRLVYGLKSSTYDRYNYITENGGISENGVMPYIGGTAVTLNENDGSINSICNMLTKGLYADVTDKGIYNEDTGIFTFNNVDASIKKNQNAATVNGKNLNFFRKAVYVKDNENGNKFYVPAELDKTVDDIIDLKENKLKIYVDYNSGAVTAKGCTGTTYTPVSVMVTKPGKNLGEELKKDDIAYADQVYSDVYGEYSLTFNSEILEGEYTFSTNYYLNTTEGVTSKKFTFVNTVPSLTVEMNGKSVKRMLQLVPGDVIDVKLSGFDFEDDFNGAVIVGQYSGGRLISVSHASVTGGSALAGSGINKEATVMSGTDMIKVMYWNENSLAPIIGSYVIE